MTLLVSLHKIRRPKRLAVGGKGYALAVLSSAGLPVPRAFVVTTGAFHEYLSHNGLRPFGETWDRFASSNRPRRLASTRRAIYKGSMPASLIAELRHQLTTLHFDRVAVRSSAVSEDSSRASFAGIHDTFLNVPARSGVVAKCVKRCWVSSLSDRALLYRRQLGLPPFDGIAVVVQAMIPARASGVAFTVDPTDADAMVVEAAPGLGDLLVRGAVQPDRYRLDRRSLMIEEKAIGSKRRMRVTRAEGTHVVAVPSSIVAAQVLTDDTLRRVARLCLRVERIFGDHPQDIEWCLADGQIWLLQARPVSRTGLMPRREDRDDDT